MRCVITHNIAENSGGGIYLKNSTVTMTDCEISNNSVIVDTPVHSGGGIYCKNTELTVSNCNITGNSAPGNGGGIYHNSKLILTNSQVANNSAKFGGGIYNIETASSQSVYGGSSWQTNTFDSNHAIVGADLLAHENALEINATYNHFTGYFLSDYYVGLRENFDLSHSTSDLVPITDNAYVAPDGNDANNGKTPETPFRTILHAFKNVYGTETEPVTITLAPGTYSPSLTGETFPIPLVNGISIIGSHGPENTIINAEETGGVFYGDDDSVLLNGLTITGGSAPGVFGVFSTFIITNCFVKDNILSGGIYTYQSVLHLIDCLIQGNKNGDSGGGVSFLEDTRALNSFSMSGCNVRANESGNRGGGVYCERVADYSIETVMENCIAENNVSTGSGGGIFCNSNYYSRDHQFKVIACIFVGNSCQDIYSTGGGVETGGCWDFIQCEFTENSATSGSALCTWEINNTSLTNCFIVGNTGEYGAICLDPSTHKFDILNCTIVGNTCSNASSGALDLRTGYFGENINTITNCILWNNTPRQISWEPRENASIKVTYSCVQSGYPGISCIQSDPMFVSETDYRLTVNSPCIDAGTDVGAPSIDLTGKPRPQGGDVDIGAYEFSGWPSRPHPYLAMSNVNPGPGDSVDCKAVLWNPNPEPLVNYPLFVILDAFGALYFAPTFSSFDYYQQTFPEGLTIIPVLPEFQWPDGAGQARGLFWYSALTNPEMTELHGHLDTLEFGYSK